MQFRCGIKIVVAVIFVIACGCLLGTVKGAKNEKLESPTVVLDGTIYLIWHDDKLSWWGARDFCEERKMKLVSLQNADKTDILSAYLEEKGFVDTAERGNEFIYWTSGTDQKSKGKYRWHATGEPFTYTNWLPDMPDNWRGDEHCVELGFRELGKWNDNRCRYNRHFICEIPQGADAGVV